MKLAAELPGILLWALEGCRLWQDEGLEPPPRVNMATTGYRTAEDLIGRFLEDECVVESKAGVSKSELYVALEIWCADAGEDPPSKRALGARLVDLGLEEMRTSGSRMWRGICLARPGEALLPAAARKS
jgi:putative DNA primase/helicase